MQDESDDMLEDDAEKDPLLAMEEAAAAAAAFRQANSHRLQQQKQHGQQPSVDVQQMLKRAQAAINPSLLPDSVERQRQQQRLRELAQERDRLRQQQQLLQQQRELELRQRRGTTELHYGREALEGPFGQVVERATALRQDLMHPVARVEGDGE